MSKDLVPFNVDQLPSTQIGSDEAFNDLAKGGDFLKYAKLCSNDKFTKAGKIMPGHWGIPDNNGEIADLGPAIDILPLARRPKALDTKDKSAIVVSYDETSSEFKRIAAQSLEKDSGCQQGISFLVLERSTGEFLEIYFGSKSTCPEAKKVYPCLPLTQADIDRREANKQDVTGLKPHGPVPLTLKIRLAESKKTGLSWHVPDPVKCSSPFTKLPPMETISKEITKFLSPKSGGVEKVEETSKKRAR